MYEPLTFRQAVFIIYGIVGRVPLLLGILLLGRLWHHRFPTLESRWDFVRFYVVYTWKTRRLLAR